MSRMLILKFEDDEKPIFEETIQFLRRISGVQEITLQDKNILSVANLIINLEQRAVYRDGQEIHLTSKEFGILCMLVVNESRVILYVRIYENIWGVPSDGGANRILNYHVRNLRKKLNKDLQEPIYYIRCVRDVGYRFEC